MKQEYDVIVVGGGTAGIVAAIQAGRAGASTLLVEKQGILGGTLVVGGISYPASFFAHGKQIIAGIGWELCSQTWQQTGEAIVDPATAPPWMRQAGIVHHETNPAVFAALADHAVLDAGVDLLLHSMPAAVTREDGSWSLVLCTKTGLRTIRSAVLIDCTGDANVVTLAGLEVERNAELQAATLVVHVGGYDAETLDYEAIQAAFNREVAEGGMLRTDPGWQHGRVDFFLRSYGGNRIHVVGVDGRTSEGKTQAEIEGRRAMLRMLRFCREQPGLEGFRIISCATECGIRETVTIKGLKKITLSDYESGRLWEHAVCYSFYTIDSHRADFIRGHSIGPGVFPTIPLGALLPCGGTGIIVAGRCASGDADANSAYRVEASCMAMGQAAGAAAALAANRGGDFTAVPLPELRELLRRHGAIVPGTVEDDPGPPAAANAGEPGA
jgi:hypothetical protein